MPSILRSLLVTAAVVGTAGAQGTSAAPDTLAAVIVTATRTTFAPAAPFSSTTVLHGADLRAAGIARLGDALRLVPGLQVVASGALGSQTSLFLRGGNSGYVRVLVDGVPVNDAGGFVDVANLTTHNVRRIEVVRGPASVLYGSDAMSGVIQIFTDAGERNAGWSAGVRAGSAGAREADASFARTFSRSSLALGVARHETDGTLPFNNQYANDGLSFALRHAPSDAADVTATVRWTGSTYHYPTDFSGAIVDRNAEQSEHRLVASVDGGRRIGRADWRLMMGTTEHLPRTNDAADGPADTLGFFAYRSRSVRVRRVADARVNIAVRPRTAVTLGADIARERERSTSWTDSEYGSSTDGFAAARSNGAVYAQVVGDAGMRTSYQLGARHDLNSAFGRHSTVRAGVGVALTAGVRLHAAGGTAFKAPSFYENFATGYVRGNPALEPETSQSLEAGLTARSADRRLTASVTASAQAFRNIVDYTGSPPTATAPNYFNVAGATARSVEAEATYRTEGLAVTMGYSFVNARADRTGFDSTAGASYVRGERLLRRAPHVISIAVARSFAGIDARLTAQRVGGREDRDFTVYPAARVTLPAHTRVDGAVTVPLARAGVSATARVENLFGATYEDVVGFRAPGRLAVVGVRFSPP